MSGERVATDAELLAAYRDVTGWTDEEVLHYASCDECDPRDGDYTWYCDNSPNRRGEQKRKPVGEFLYSPFRTELAPAFRRPGA